MDQLKACNLEQLTDRITNVRDVLPHMGEKGRAQVSRSFLTAMLNYMEELLELRRKLQARRPTGENKLMTVADNIRSMSNEELASLLNEAEGAGYNDSSIAPQLETGYSMDMLKWLNQPYTRKPE